MPKLPQHLQTTLDTLRAHVTANGQCRTPLAELAQERDISRHSMYRHIADLEKRGYISVRRHKGKPAICQLMPDSKFKRIAGRLRNLLSKQAGIFPAPQLPSSPAQLAPSAQPPSTGPSMDSGGSSGRRFDKTQDRRIEGTVGRQDILATLQENVAKRQHTLLVGPLGIGKSHILRHFAEQRSQEATKREEPENRNPKSTIRNPKLLYLDHVSPIKPALLTLAQRLHADGNLAVAGIEADYMEWEDVRKKIAPLRVNQLAELVIECLVPRAERTEGACPEPAEGMKDQGYVLLLDHLERVTPTMLPHLDALMEVAVVIAATDELKPSAQRLWWAFERVEVPPLPRDQARELLWQVADRDRVARPQLFETRVLQQAGGNPLAIVTMAGKAAPRGTDRDAPTATLSAQEIRGLRHGAGVRYISLTPALMLVGALIIAARFVALGLNDRDLYVLAGLGYASFFFMRYFIYRID